MPSRQFCRFCLVYLVLLIVRITVYANSTADPMFASRRMTNIFLGSNEIWIPGTTTMITVLNIEDTLTMQFNITDSNGAASSVESHTLMYGCSGEDSANQEILLWSKDGTSQSWKTEYCSSTSSQFSIARLSDTKYSLKLLRNSVKYDRALKHSLELRLRFLILDSNVTTKSGSLFIFNIEPIMTMNANEITNNDTNYKLFMLTTESIAVLTGCDNTEDGSIREVRFLSEEFVNIFHSAPALIRSLLSVTVTLHTVSNISACLCKKNLLNDASIKDKQMLSFFSGDIYTAESLHPRSTIVTGHINLETGMLMYVNNITHIFSSGFVICACLRVSLGTNTWDHHAFGRVAAFHSSKTPARSSDLSKHPLRDHSKRSEQCKINRDPSSVSLTLFAGLSGVTVTSPIVCNMGSAISLTLMGDSCQREEKGLFKIQRIEKLPMCGNFTPSIVGAIFVAMEAVNAIQHTGTLRFESVSNKFFNYRVRVVSLPLFNTETQSGELPPLTHAAIHLKVTFDCTIFHSGLQNPSLYLVVRKSDGQIYDMDKFAMEMLKKSPRDVQASHSRQDTNCTLQVVLPHVQNIWEPWNLMAFICRGDIADEEAKELLGVPGYRTESSSRIQYDGVDAGLSNTGNGELRIDCLALIESILVYFALGAQF